MGLLVAYLLQVAMKMTHGQEMTWHGVETSIQKKIKDTDLIVNTTPPEVSRAMQVSILDLVTHLRDVGLTYQAWAHSLLVN